jgi:DNA-directed RNA polymerase specialized sigma24 family protein
MWPAGQLANAYLDKATTKRERKLRSRRLMAFGAQKYFGLSQADIAAGFGLDQSTISVEITRVRPALHLEAEDLGIDADRIIGPSQDSEAE